MKATKITYRTIELGGIVYEQATYFDAEGNVIEIRLNEVSVY